MNLKVILLEGVPTNADVIVAKIRITILSQFCKTGTVSHLDEETILSEIGKEKTNTKPAIETTIVLNKKKGGHLFMAFCRNVNECNNLEELFSKMNPGIEMRTNKTDDFAEKVELKDNEIKLLQLEIERAKLNLLLSKRELEILYFIAAGESIKEIAKRLFLSPATIATYRARLLSKLELKSNIDLVRYAIRTGLIN